ncbi:hypothetical protein AB5I41_02920 [Sphingomonas sp. MMS24-JH45]
MRRTSTWRRCSTTCSTSWSRRRPPDARAPGLDALARSVGHGADRTARRGGGAGAGADPGARRLAAISPTC